MRKLNIDLYAAQERVMNSLKDFQRATVNRVDAVFRSGQKRILVADEVGLGKTLIAKGVIAKTAVLRYEQADPLFKVVYICSNQSIAGQNLSKLRIADKIRMEDIGSSRLSMQHLNIFTQMHDEEILAGYIQLIPLTPDTSFRMTTGAGSVSERALMFAILRRLPFLQPYENQLKIAMQDTAFKAWNEWARAWYEERVQECDAKTNGEYLRYMVDKAACSIQQEGLDKALIELCDRIRDNGGRRIQANSVIGRLRIMFAQISVDLLEPDLVIMDEFQRFKYLIDADAVSETGLLAKRFFSNNEVKMLLLSATPYKLYSTLEEIEETQVDEHYAEFFKVLGFLYSDNIKFDCFKDVWNNYSIRLRELNMNDATIIEAKRHAEDSLYRVVCRTERMSAIQTGDFIDDSSTKKHLKVNEKDIITYIQAQQLLDEIKANMALPVDFVKSSPYILSFMRDYKVKRAIERYFKAHPEEIQKADMQYLWIKRSTLLNYKPLDAVNARLESLKEAAFESKAELLLWIPASKPYYEPGGVFRNADCFSKILVFSAWEMVPRMISVMISYEAERRTVGKLSLRANKEEMKNANYFAKNSLRYPVSRLRFSLSEGVPRSMNLLCLLYPSEFLAECFQPIDVLNRHISLRELENEISQKILKRLNSVGLSEKTTGGTDERWYYLVPLFLDDESYVRNWFDGTDTIIDSDPDDENDAAEKRRGGQGQGQGRQGQGQRGLKAHIDLMRQYRFDPDLVLGRRPDDLLEVLTNMALASPAICAYRTNGGNGRSSTVSEQTNKGSECETDRKGQHEADGKSLREIDRASQIAKAFMNRLNSPESTSIVELCYGRRNDNAHWKNVLAYCKAGNLQSVFDEYAHILTESYNLSQASDRGSVLHQLMLESMQVHSASYSIDTFKNFEGRVKGYRSWPVSVRTHYAVGFTKGEGNTDKDFDRKKSVRNSFNSPFRPFVLATTSIGQEGLDFHYYCRKIMHWNLPSNPIDLEQREGRINRFKCLAIRQNVARQYGDITFSKSIWDEMFQNALIHEKDEHNAELVPFWCLSNDQKVKIERIVPLYPLSRDISSYERLIKILSLYRLTLGQARQEELLEYILTNYEADEDLKKLFINLSPFSKEKGSGI